jgi:hypothetical protein
VFAIIIVPVTNSRQPMDKGISGMRLKKSLGDRPGFASRYSNDADAAVTQSR